MLVAVAAAVLAVGGYGLYGRFSSDDEMTDSGIDSVVSDGSPNESGEDVASRQLPERNEDLPSQEVIEEAQRR